MERNTNYYIINHQVGIVDDKLHIKLWSRTRKLGPDGKYYLTRHLNTLTCNPGDYDAVLNFTNRFNLQIQRWQQSGEINLSLIDEFGTSVHSLDENQNP